MVRCCTLVCALLLVMDIATINAADPASLDISGCWSGYWISCSDGHSGPLQATICKVADDCYRAQFKGRFFAVIPFRYSTTFRVVSSESDKVILAGEQRLGPVLGSYTFTATVTATDFDASYIARRDQGKFVMTRVAP